MANPWDPERVVSPDLARDLLETQFPSLAPVRVEPLGAGWDNTAYRVNRHLVFRFPRRQIAVDLLRTEIGVLPHIASRIALSVPMPDWVGQPCPSFPWPFAGYRRLEGRTACSVPLSDEDRHRIAVPLATFLKTMHAVPIEEASAWGAGPDTIGRLDIRRLGEQIRRHLGEMLVAGAIDDAAKWLAILESAAPRHPPRLALLHGDLYARHLLVDGNRRLCGVIDFGDLHCGDPAVDLSIVWTFLPPAARKPFFESYGEVDKEALDLARARALMSATAVWAYGRDRNDHALVADGLRALHCVAQS